MDRLMVAITPGHGYPWAVPEASQVPMAVTSKCAEINSNIIVRS